MIRNRFVHRMGGLAFLTESSIAFPALDDHRLDSFKDASAAAFDFRSSIDAVGLDDLTLPEPSVGLRNLILKCHRPGRIRGGSQVLPLLLDRRSGDAAQSFRDLPFDETNVPLLRAPSVRDRLEEAVRGSADPSRISLLLHTLTVEIRDFEGLTASVFIAGGLEDSLSTPSAFYSLRKLFSLFLPTRDAFLVHCSTVVLGDGAVLLAAADGGGKTTASRLAPPCSVMGDDRCLIRFTDDMFDAFPTPWNTICDVGSPARVSGVFVIEKASSFYVRRSRPREAAAFLWDDNRSYFEDLPARERSRAFDMILGMCRSVPCGVVGFAPGLLEWDRIARVMDA